MNIEINASKAESGQWNAPSTAERTFLSCLNKDNFSPYKMKVINSMTQHGNSEHTRQFHLHTLLSTTFEGDEQSTK